jgi:hypothetical protein
MIDQSRNFPNLYGSSLNHVESPGIGSICFAFERISDDETELITHRIYFYEHSVLEADFVCELSFPAILSIGLTESLPDNRRVFDLRFDRGGIKIAYSDFSFHTNAKKLLGDTEK